VGPRNVVGSIENAREKGSEVVEQVVNIYNAMQ